MAQVRLLDKSNAPEKSKAIFEKLPALANVFRAMGHAPDVLAGFVALRNGIRTGLDEKYLELAYLLASTRNACDYCLGKHVEMGRKAGLTDDKIREVGAWMDSKFYDDRERTVLRFAEQVTVEGIAAQDTLDALKKFLSEEALVVLTATVCLANFTNRFNKTLAIEQDK